LSVSYGCGCDHEVIHAQCLGCSDGQNASDDPRSIAVHGVGSAPLAPPWRSAHGEVLHWRWGYAEALPCGVQKPPTVPPRRAPLFASFERAFMGTPASRLPIHAPGSAVWSPQQRNACRTSEFTLKLHMRRSHADHSGWQETF
jgi:hypothetical protein